MRGGASAAAPFARPFGPARATMDLAHFWGNPPFFCLRASLRRKEVEGGRIQRASSSSRSTSATVRRRGVHGEEGLGNGWRRKCRRC